MRTTLTLDDDVAARLHQLRRKGRSFREIVNSTLRAGLDACERDAAASQGRYRIRPHQGRPKRIDLDNVADVLAESEGDGYR